MSGRGGWGHETSRGPALGEAKGKCFNAAAKELSVTTGMRRAWDRNSAQASLFTGEGNEAQKVLWLALRSHSQLRTEPGLELGRELSTCH